MPPPYIVSQAWLRLEQAIREALDTRYIRSGLPPRPRLNYLRAARTVGLLSDDEMPALELLSQLRNHAVHLLDPGITITDALRYHDIVDALIQQLKQQPPTSSDFPEIAYATGTRRFERGLSNVSFPPRPWKNAFAEDGGPT